MNNVFHPVFIKLYADYIKADLTILWIFRRESQGSLFHKVFFLKVYIFFRDPIIEALSGLNLSKH